MPSRRGVFRLAHDLDLGIAGHRARDARPLVLESTKVIEERGGPDGLFTRLATDRAARVRAAASPLDPEQR